MKVTKAQRQEAIEMIKKFVKPGDTVYTVIRGVSRSGMSRTMDVFAFYTDERGKIRKQYLTGWCVRLGLGTQSLEMWRRSTGMRVNGCGMDMGWHVVESLSAILFGRNKENGIGDALKQEWI